MNKTLSKTVLSLFLSVLFVSCANEQKSNQSQKQTASTENQNSSTEKEMKKTTYTQNDMYVKTDSLPVVQVNPNVTRKMTHLDNVMMTIVEFSNGPMAEPDPFHSHVHEQMTYIAEGECLVLIGDTKQKLKAGDIFAVPSNVPHSVQSLTKKLKLIDTFSPIREDFLASK